MKAPGMQRFFKDLLTGPDNQTYEISHILWAVGVLAFIIMVAYVVFKTGSYPTGFGQDFGLLSAGGGASAFARAQSDKTMAGKDGTPPSS